MSVETEIQDPNKDVDVNAIDAEPTVIDQSPEDAVLDAIGLGENPAEKESGEEPEDADPKAGSDEKAKEEPEDAGNKELTDADLEPLGSKNEATNKRFQKVTEGYKQEKQRNEALSAEVARFKQSFEALNNLGFNDEAAANDLVSLSEYRKIIKAGDVEGFREAIANQIRQFEAAHGKKVNVSASGLDNHPDLKAKVESLEMDEDVALELARSRVINERIQRDSQAKVDNQSATAEFNQVLSQSVADVEALQAHWEKNDPDYLAVLPHLQTQIEEIGKKYPPAQWASLIDLQYKSLKKALIQAGGQVGRTLPLSGNSRTSTKPAPSTPEEAVLQSLGLDGE